MINKKKWFSPLFVVFLAVAGIFSISSYVSNKQVEETPVVEKVEANNTSCTIYYACSTNDTVKLNVCQSYSENLWVTVTMTKLSKTFNGTPVYTATATEKYGGFDCLQFLFFNGSGQQTSYIDIFTSWNTKDVFHNKIWDGSWKTYNPDVIVTKYAVCNGSKINDSIGTDSVAYNTTYNVPSNASRYGFTFGGWFTDVTCNTSYTARKLTSNIDIYAKFTADNLAIEGAKYYLSLDNNYGNWEQANDWFAVFLLAPDESTAEWVKLNKYGTTHFYYFTAPSGTWYKMIWVRMKSSDTSTLDWSNSDNQSVDILFDSGKYYWFMDSGQWGSQAMGATGSWTGDYREFESQLDPSPSTMRYWFVFTEGDTGYSITQSGGRPGITINDGSSDHNYLMRSQFNSGIDSGTHYFYVDVPINTVSFKILRVSSGSETVGNFMVWQTQANTTQTVSNYKPSRLWVSVFYFYKSGGNPDVNNRNCSVVMSANDEVGTYTVSAYTAAAVLSAYYTCSSSDLNGNGAASYLASNFMNHTDDTNGDFNVVDFLDYSYEDYVNAGKNYNYCSRSSTYRVTVNQKWAELSGAASKYGAIRTFNPFTLFNGEEDNFSTVIIIVASSISLLSITALSVLVIKKRKSKEE